MEYINIAKILLHPIPATTQQHVVNTLQMHITYYEGEEEEEKKKKFYYSD
jgi:predicted phosphoadenosine phosphosulfate sulfurtransferase